MAIAILMSWCGFFFLAAYHQQGVGFEYVQKVPEVETFLADGFEYPPQPKLQYNNCEIKKDYTLFLSL